MKSSAPRRNMPLELGREVEGREDGDLRRREPWWENWMVPMVVDVSMLMGESEALVMVAIGPQRVS